MSQRRCINCLTKMGETRYCTQCGYDSQKEAEETAALPLAPFTVLKGQYLIGRVLGEEVYGFIYTGLDLAEERRVVVKEYCPAPFVCRDRDTVGRVKWFAADQEALRRCQSGRDSFVENAGRLARVKDVPELVEALDIFCENNTDYVVMDFAGGRALSGMIEKNGALGFEEAAHMLLPLIRGLAKAHAQGFVHGNICPENIILGESGPRLLGGGNTRDMMRDDPSSGILPSNYMGCCAAMEQYSSAGAVGPWTDVYAVCAALYFAAVGKNIPCAPERADTDDKNSGDIPAETLSQGQLEVLRDGLAMPPQNRIQTMEALEEKLVGALFHRP